MIAKLISFNMAMAKLYIYILLFSRHNSVLCSLSLSGPVTTCRLSGLFELVGGTDYLLDQLQVVESVLLVACPAKDGSHLMLAHISFLVSGDAIYIRQYRSQRVDGSLTWTPSGRLLQERDSIHS